MNTCSYDRLGSDEIQDGILTDRISSSILEREKGQFFARRRKEEELCAPVTSYLLPEYCNIHEFRASEFIGCAILDIVAPPYDPKSHRDCTYYKLFKSLALKQQDEDIFILQEQCPPADFHVITIPYTGPAVKKSS